MNFTAEIYRGKSSWFQDGKITDKKVVAKYLPQEYLEPPQAYTGRIGRSPFNAAFKQAIEAFAGLLPIDSLSEDIHPTIEEYRKDVDLRGNNLDAFWDKADEMTLRDGMVGVLVEFPRQPRDEKGQPLIRTAADEKRFKLRPYLCLIDRRDIISWRVSYLNGKMQIQQIVIKECRIEPKDLFGEEEEIYYRVLRPGSFEVWQVRRENDGKGEWVAELIEQGKTSLQEVPLVLYSATDTCPFEAEPPLKNLSELSVTWLQVASGRYELLHRVNMPVPVRKGLVMPGQVEFSGLPPLVIGPNSCVDVPETGDFFFAEPSGASLAESRAELNELSLAMDRATLGFLSGDAGSEKTATEVQFRSGSTQASLAGMARMKESALENVFRLWAAYYSSEIGGSATINKSILQMATDPQQIDVFSKLAAQKQISLLTLLKMLKEGKILPRDCNPEEELQRIQEQSSEEARASLEQQKAVMALSPATPGFVNQDGKASDRRPPRSK